MCVQHTAGTAAVCLTNVRCCRVPYGIDGGGHVWHAIYILHVFIKTKALIPDILIAAA